MIRCPAGSYAVRSREGAYLLTKTWASKPGLGRPRSMGRDGSGACVNASQPVQAMRGRTIRFTMNRPDARQRLVFKPREGGRMDLSRFGAAPDARLGHFPFESDRAFPTQC